LVGPSKGAVEIRRGNKVSRRDLISRGQVDKVLIDPETHSATLILARLLTRQGGAQLVGPDDMTGD